MASSLRPEVVMAECTAAHEREAHDVYRKMIELHEWLWEHRTYLYFDDFELVGCLYGGCADDQAA